MNYKIYEYTVTWEYVTTVLEKQLNSAIAGMNDTSYIMIVKHDIKQDMDEVYYHGYKENYKSKQKVKYEINRKKI